MERRNFIKAVGAAGVVGGIAGCTDDDGGPVDDCPDLPQPEVEVYEVGENVEFSGDGTMMDTGDVRVEDAWVQNTAFLNPTGSPSVFGETGEVFIIFEFVFPDYDEENRNRFDSQHNYAASIHAAGDCDGRYRFDDVVPAVSESVGVFEGVRMFERERDTLLGIQSVDADLLGNDAEIVVLGDDRNVGWDMSDEFGEQEFAELVIENLSIEERDDGLYGIFEGGNRTDNAGVGRFVASIGALDEVWVETTVDAGGTFTWERELTPEGGNAMFQVETAFDEENVTYTD